MNSAQLVDEERNELGTFSVATPCQVPWSNMKGDDRVRRCRQCNLDVTNIEALSTSEARELLARAACGGRVCVRYYRRFDGTVLTKDCEGGLRHSWKEAKRRRTRSNVLAAFGYFGIVMVTVWVFAAMLFGDNIRRAFGMSAGGVTANDNVQMRPPQEPKHTMGFSGPADTY